MANVQKIEGTIEKINKIIVNVLIERKINVFHVVLVAPMIAYIGYLAINNKPITFGKSLLILAMLMALFHLHKILELFMIEYVKIGEHSPPTTIPPIIVVA